MKIFYSFYLLLFLISCKVSPEFDAEEKEKVMNDALAMLKNYHKAIEKDGLLAEFDYLDDSSDFFWVPPGYTSALSYDSVKAILEFNAKNFSAVQFSWSQLDLFPLSSSIVNFTGTVDGKMTDLSGQNTSMSILESGTLIKRAGGWKLLSGQSRMLNESDSEQSLLK